MSFRFDERRSEWTSIYFCSMERQKVTSNEKFDACFQQYHWLDLFHTISTSKYTMGLFMPIYLGMHDLAVSYWFNGIWSGKFIYIQNKPHSCLYSGMLVNVCYNIMVLLFGSISFTSETNYCTVFRFALAAFVLNMNRRKWNSPIQENRLYYSISETRFQGILTFIHEATGLYANDDKNGHEPNMYQSFNVYDSWRNAHSNKWKILAILDRLVLLWAYWMTVVYPDGQIKSQATIRLPSIKFHFFFNISNEFHSFRISFSTSAQQVMWMKMRGASWVDSEKVIFPRNAIVNVYMHLCVYSKIDYGMQL